MYVYNSIKGQINGNEGIYEDCRCKKIGDSMREYQMLFSIVLAFVSVPSGVLSSAVAVAFVPVESLLSSSAAAAAAAAFSVVGGGAYFSGDRFAVSADFTVDAAGSRREENTNSRISQGFSCRNTIAMKPGKGGGVQSPPPPPPLQVNEMRNIHFYQNTSSDHEHAITPLHESDISEHEDRQISIP